MTDKGCPVLSIEGLTVGFPVEGKLCPAVKNAFLVVNPGEMTALVGESGCGKTVTALTAMGLQSENAKITSGKVLFQGRDLLRLSPEEWNHCRGKDISMIFQEPMTALNPLMQIGKQVAEGARVHGASKKEAKEKALAVMAQVGLPDVERLYREYPHRLSGGMRQRVMIAMALINRPALLIADEPTTALDVTIQAQIMELLRRMNKELGTAVLLISHDLGVVRSMCSRVSIMYAGQIVESGPVEEVLLKPSHPYTRGLLASTPSPAKRGQKLSPIPGTVPGLQSRRETGCPFFDRCGVRRESCEREDPPVIEAGERTVRCILGKEALGK